MIFMKTNYRKYFLLISLLFLSKIYLAFGINKIETSKQPIMSTEQVLREYLGYDEQYLKKFMDFVQQAELNPNLDNLLIGKVDSQELYSEAEKEQIIETLKKLIKQQFSITKPSQQKKYISSAGAPGTGKTFFLEKIHNINVAKGKFPTNAIYIGPDSVVLPQMDNYLSYSNDPKLGPAAAYTKWRDSSNYIANFMLVKAIVDGVNIVHDTTLTSPYVKNLLDVLKNKGYYIEAHFFIADKNIRKQTIEYRKEKLGGDPMVTTIDAVNKAKNAYMRLIDHTYENRVNKYTLYLQEGKFYKGKGKTVAFAVYEPKQSNFVKVLPFKEKLVKKFLQLVDQEENLTSELKASIHEFVKTWTKNNKK